MSVNNLPKLSDDLLELVIKLNTKIFNQQEFLKSLHIPPSHVKVIFYLVHNGASPVSYIAEQLCISKPNMTPIIDKLISEGLVFRSEDPKDRRVILIEITDKATALFEAHKSMMKQRLAEKVAHLCPQDIQEFDKCIQMLMPLLEKLK